MKNLSRDFWRGRRVFVTGHTGFKGSWLVTWLIDMGADVVGYSLEPNTEPSIFQAANIASGMNSVIGDIRNAGDLAGALEAHQPEVVFHLAAQPLVRYSYGHPVETYETNVMGTLHLMEAVRAAGSVRAAVMVTSDKCYENNEWVWGYRESDPMGGRDPYSSSKGCAELLIKSYRDSYFSDPGEDKEWTAIASVRSGNVIGGGDWSEDRIVPDAVRAFVAGEPLEVRSPGAIRPWQHVLEPLSGYILLAEQLVNEGVGYTGAWNFGPNPDDAKSVSSIVDTLVRFWGEGAGWRSVSDQKLHEANYLKLECAKARDILHWQPRWNLEEAIEKTVEWYKAFYAGEDVLSLMKTQIGQYESVPG
ncbi:MAG: CDP-glucose 4,6-dehydratase [Sedimenticola sp.]